MSSLPNTDKLYETFFDFLAKREFLAGSLGNRLVFQILAVSAVLSFFTSSIQLFVGYQQDRQSLDEITTAVEQSLSSAFSNALWEYNFELAEALLEGVYDKEHVEHVVLTTPQGREWTRGFAQVDHDVSTLKIVYQHEGDAHKSVGTLHIGISDTEVMQRLWKQAWVVLATNFLKAMLVSIAISILFQWNVGRHLHKVAGHVSQSNWQDANKRLELDRPFRQHDEDIEAVVQAICGARLRAHQDFELLETEIDMRIQAEKNLRLRTDELEHAYREQSEFTYAISHDMKSPTNTIKLLSGDLKSLLADNTDDVVAEILNDLDTTVNRMSSLIDDVLQYALSVNDAPATSAVPLNDLIEEILADLKDDIETTNAHIIVDALPTLEGNRTQVRLLFQNLISNALKFRAADRTPIVEIECYHRERKAFIRVRDNGIGIPTKHYHRIFGMFNRLHTQSEYEGTGLGLSLCKRIVLNHNGTINVFSMVGQGTTFEIALWRRRDA